MTELVPLPTSPYCRVRARLAAVHADGPDEGSAPDWVPAVGETVELTPSISGLLTYDVAGADPVIIRLARVQCVVDADGWLTKPDGRPVYIAATDDPLMSVTGWTWSAQIGQQQVRFSAPSGGVVDLALFVAAPAVDATRAWVERIPELIDAAGNLVSIESVARDGDDMVVALTSGSVFRFPLPEGAPGPAPEISWIDTSLVVDDQPPVDLKGDKGDPGPANSLTVGTVTTGAPGTAADFSITGTAPDQVLNLTIPQGLPGQPTQYDIVGAGRPDIPATMTTEVAALVAAATSGAKFRSTDGPQGAWEWQKRGATWVCVEGHARADLSGLLTNGWAGSFVAERSADTITYWSNGLATEGSTATNLLILPVGFRPVMADVGETVQRGLMTMKVGGALHNPARGTISRIGGSSHWVDVGEGRSTFTPNPIYLPPLTIPAERKNWPTTLTF